MMVIMNEGASAEALAHVVARIEESGASAHVSSGERVTVIGVIGDREVITGLPLEGMTGVDRVVAILKPYKLVSREFQHRDTVVDVNGVRIGGGHFAIMAGPCSVETREQVMAAAMAVQQAGGHLLRGGAFKPRTSPYAFQGLGEDGLKMLAEARDATGLPIVTEVMDTATCRRSSPSTPTCCRSAPATCRTSRCSPRSGGCGKPVLLKRGLSPTIEELLMAAEYIIAKGNRDVILCERGIRTFETATRNTLRHQRDPGDQALSHLPVIVDPSHATGRRELVRRCRWPASPPARTA